MLNARWTTVLALVLALVAAPAFGQGGTTSATLNGVVSDRDGKVPGATVVLKNVATGETLAPIVTNETGTYSFPGLAPGTYKVTITMPNYKTAEVEVRLLSGSTSTVPTMLELGTREEVVKVVASSDLVRTDTPTVSTTVNADFMQTLPRSNRNALNFVIYLPGVTTVGGAAGARNNTTIAGLPNNTFNITIDGITNGNLLQSGDGFFSMVTPRLDAVEEVTLTTASAGADASGQGAIQIRFVTRSGTNKFETSLYWFMQHELFNSNSYFNRLSGLPVPAATNYTYGGRIGGPIILPGFDGRGKAFFFFNQEEVYNPLEASRTRTMIRQSALDGNFCYGITGAPTCVNVMTLGATFNGGQFASVSQYDPQIRSILETIRTAAGTTGTITETVTAPNTATYAFLSPAKVLRHNPTANVTFNLSPKHRLQGWYYWQRFVDGPDTLNNGDATFPGMPAFGDTTSYRTTGSLSLRSTLSTAVVNEMRGGWAWAPGGFFTNSNPDMFDNQGGYAVSLGFGLTNIHPGAANGPSERNTANYTVSDQLNWLKGSHSFQFGGDFTRIDDWAINYNNVPALSLGYSTTFDPAEAMFSATTFPGSSTGDRNNAKALYALLTGRVSSINVTARLNEAGDEYIYNGPTLRREYQDDYSFYAQDVWRWKPTVTMTFGMRYQYTLPMNPANSVFSTITTYDACGPSGLGQGVSADGATDRFCNMFQPGYLPSPAVTPTYIQYDVTNKGYNTDFNNIGPNVGIAWRPNRQTGWLRTFLGDPELATINAGYTRSFNRERMDQFLNVYDGNPGQTIPATRSTSSTAFPLVLPGESWPILYSQKSRLGPPAFNPSPAFPIAASTIAANGLCSPCGSSWNFNPDIEVPWVDSWNLSFQRAITKDTVFEVRYQGNRAYKAWTTENWNTTNVYETGWLNGEFEKAQANLRANVLAGFPGDGFRYTGRPGTSPLPITFAHFNGAQGSPTNPASYIGALWTNATFTGALDPYFPDPYRLRRQSRGSDQHGGAVGPQHQALRKRRRRRYPTNYWNMNSQLSGVNVVTNSANRPQNHFVILQVRRRLAAGLAAQLSYTWQKNVSGTRLDFHLPLLYLEGNSVPHALQTLWTYDIPVGRGKQDGANMNPWLDGVVGGWSFSGTARFQRQSFHIRNAVLVGMTVEEAQNALSLIRFVTDPVTGAISVFNFPEDIYTNTRLAYNTDELQPTFYAPGTEPNGPLATPTADGTYRYFAPASSPSCNFIYTGDCNTTEMYFLGRWFGEMDFRLAKAFQLPGRARFEFSAEVFNATKAINFPTTINPSTSANAFRMTTSQTGARTAQLVWRVSW